MNNFQYDQNLHNQETHLYLHAYKLDTFLTNLLIRLLYYILSHFEKLYFSICLMKDLILLRLSIIL